MGGKILLCLPRGAMTESGRGRFSCWAMGNEGGSGLASVMTSLMSCANHAASSCVQPASSNRGEADCDWRKSDGELR